MNKLYKNLNWLAWVKIFLVILLRFQPLVHRDSIH